MENNKKQTGILPKVLILIAFVLAIFAGGYFLLDKIVVPKYFKQYGIGGVGDLVDVVSALYRNPKEEKLIKNGYSQTDLVNGISKLQEAGYKIEDNGTIKDENMDTFKGSGKIEITDREFTAICNELLKNGLLDKSLTNVNYLNTTKIALIDLVVTPSADEEIDEEDNTFEKAHINFIIRVDTTKLREQIAEQMETPIYLLKMIIPDQMYFEVSYDIDLLQENENRTNGQISINGRPAKKSETFLNLLIGFIFDEEANMDLEKFTSEVGNIMLQAIDSLGDFKFLRFSKTKQYGFVVNEVEIDEP